MPRRSVRSCDASGNNISLFFRNVTQTGLLTRALLRSRPIHSPIAGRHGASPDGIHRHDCTETTSAATNFISFSHRLLKVVSSFLFSCPCMDFPTVLFVTRCLVDLLSGVPPAPDGNAEPQRVFRAHPPRCRLDTTLGCRLPASRNSTRMFSFRAHVLAPRHDGTLRQRGTHTEV